MKLVQITDTNDCQYMINVDQIIHIRNNHDTTQIVLSNGLEIITCQPYMALAEKIVAIQNIRQDKLLND
jgi:uncharacterized protein YlzI (FlbEa/FlbD family)